MYISMEDERTMMILVAILLIGTRRQQKDIDQALLDADIIFQRVKTENEAAV